jgi:hypothetical protein
MKEKYENKLDQLFKDGLSGSEDRFAFREEDWESMEALLDNKSGKKKVLFRIIYYASGIAALLLLAIGLYLYTNNDKTDPINTNLHSKNNKKNPQKDDLQSDHPVKVPAAKLPGQEESLGSNSTQSQSLYPLNHPKAAKHPSIPFSGIIPSTGYNVLPTDTNAARSNNLITRSKKDTIIDKVNNSIANNALPNNKTQNVNAAAVDTILDKNKIASIDNQVKNNNATPDTITDKNAVQAAKKQIASVKASAIKNRPQFAISILAASDANAVNSFNHSQAGTNYGVQFSVRLTKKLFISTGASYAIKPYSTNYDSYNAASYNPSVIPTNIQANCKVLDIPLNISYQLYSRGSNAIALGTGLSSYFMLKENYRFDYSAESGWKPYNLEIKNQNTHLFSVLNINANYQRKINSKFSAVIQPYMKLPLTGIGNGRVDLKSTGVALGVNWNLNSVLRPK